MTADLAGFPRIKQLAYPSASLLQPSPQLLIHTCLFQWLQVVSLALGPCQVPENPGF